MQESVADADIPETPASPEVSKSHRAERYATHTLMQSDESNRSDCAVVVLFSDGSNSKV